LTGNIGKDKIAVCCTVPPKKARKTVGKTFGFSFFLSGNTSRSVRCIFGCRKSDEEKVKIGFCAKSRILWAI
jgi:hypothetical protein